MKLARIVARRSDATPLGQIPRRLGRRDLEAPTTLFPHGKLVKQRFGEVCAGVGVLELVDRTALEAAGT